VVYVVVLLKNCEPRPRLALIGSRMNEGPRPRHDVHTRKKAQPGRRETVHDNVCQN
jgi:hypothetical protein